MDLYVRWLTTPGYLVAVERNIISNMLTKTKYNRKGTARQFGINYRSMMYWLERLGIEAND